MRVTREDGAQLSKAIATSGVSNAGNEGHWKRMVRICAERQKLNLQRMPEVSGRMPSFYRDRFACPIRPAVPRLLPLYLRLEEKVESTLQQFTQITDPVLSRSQRDLRGNHI